MDKRVTVPSTTLKDFAERILIGAKVPSPKASLMAEAVVAANLRGVDSHGVLLLPYYVAQVRSGNVDTEAEGWIVSESGGCMMYEGQHGIGHHISNICCGHVVRLAQEHGLGMAVSRNSSHFGAAAFWAQRISDAGMMAIVMTNASPSVAPWQGRDGRIGTNPICMSLPASGKGVWLLDMATTTVAKNRIVKAAYSRQPTLPAGWAMDAEGVPTQDTQKALSGLLMPLGGYKGSGLGVMVEILCGVMSGGAMSAAVGGLHSTDRRVSSSHCFLAIDVSRFMPRETFQSRMEHLISTIKSSRPAQGYDEVLVAGDPEWRMEECRLKEGIPIEESVGKSLCALAEEFAVPVPSVLRRN
jgi:LDH2 family malate/lactate/ureidoglycolate dehydrogenase